MYVIMSTNNTKIKSTGSLTYWQKYWLTKPHKESVVPVTAISKELSKSEKTSQNDSKEPAWKCRYVAIITGFLAALSMGVHRVLMSMTIVAMVNNTAITQETKIKSDSCPDLIKNLTKDEILYGHKMEGELMWSPQAQGYILSSYFIGFFMTQMPTARLAERYGCKWFFFGAILATGLFTMLIPPFSSLSVYAVIAIQVLRGLAQGVLTPLFVILISNWCPKTERSFSFSIIISAQNLGPVLGNIFAGYVSESAGGWSYVFYTAGVLEIAHAVYILFFLTESPKEHPRISKAELDFILSHQERTLSRRRPELPWRQFLTSIPVYALIFEMFGRFWAMSYFTTVHSTFLGTILHYEIGQNGLLSGIPFLSAFLFSQGAAWISLYIEQKKFVSVDVIRKLWVFTFAFGFSMCLLGSYAAGCDRKFIAISAILAVGFLGVDSSGGKIVSADMSPTFSGTIQSIGTAIGCTSTIFLPLIVGYLTEGKQTVEQWHKVSFLSIGIVMASAVSFLIFGSAKIQPWNFVEDKNEKKEEIKSENVKDDGVTRF